MHRHTHFAEWIVAGALAIGTLGSYRLHTQPASEVREAPISSAQKEPGFTQMDAGNIDAPVIILEENHEIASAREQLIGSPLAAGRVVVLEMLDSAQAQSVHAYLGGGSDTLSDGLNRLLRTFSREADASEQSHSYASLIGQARRTGTRIEGIYCHEEPQGELWGGTNWWTHRIALKDSVYASRIFEAYQKDSLARVFLVGGQHGEGVRRWLEKRGVRAWRIVAWDSTQSHEWRARNPTQGMRDSAYVERTQRTLDSLALPTGFWRAPPSYPADGVWVTRERADLRPSMPPLRPANPMQARHKPMLRPRF